MHSNEVASRATLAAGLSFCSRLYGAGVRLKAAAYRDGLLKTKRLPCKVVSIGNITVGGTGKTPMTIYLAEMLHRSGYASVVVSRGYKGKAEKYGGIVSDGRRFFMSVESSGDEPWLMAQRLQRFGVPVIVGRNRYESGRLAVKFFQPDVILLDDGFQHRSLWRDLDLVLLDSHSPFGNTHLLPRGVLREPVSALCRGDLFVLTRTNRDTEAAVVDRLQLVVGNRPVYAASHAPFISKWLPAGSSPGQEVAEATTEGGLRRLRGRHVFGFSGIAVNDRFKQTLESLGCHLVGFNGFADHHPYSRADVAALQRRADQYGADLVCTTAKDIIRLSHRGTWPLELAVIDVELSLVGRRSAFEKDVVSVLSDLADR